MATWYYEQRGDGAGDFYYSSYSEPLAGEPPAPGTWYYQSNAAVGGDWYYRSYSTEAAPLAPTILSVSGTLARGGSITANLGGFTSPPDAAFLNYGADILEIVSATTTQAVVRFIPALGRDYSYGRTYTLTLANNWGLPEQEADEIVRTHNAPTGWAYVNFSGAPSDEFDSLYRMRRDDAEEPFTASSTPVGGYPDQFIYSAETGLTVNNQTVLFVAEGAYPITGTYTVFDVSTNALLPDHEYSIVTPDGTPAAFNFTDVTGATAGSAVTSNTLTLTGFNVPILVSVTNGLLSINGGTFTASDSELEPGQTLALRGTASNTALGVVSVGVTAGGVSETWNITTSGIGGSDTTPDAFTFTDVTGATLSTVYTSNTVTISGINAAAPISITGGTYSINGGAFTAVVGTISNGQTVAVRLTSSGSFSTAASATLTIGGVSDTYTVTTQAIDTTPNPFNLIDVTGVITNTQTTSNTITVAGINAPAPISITATGIVPTTAQYSINGGTFTSAAGTVSNGQTVTVRVLSSLYPLQTVGGLLTIGGVSEQFNVTTAAADTLPDAFSFTNVTNAALSTTIDSDIVTITGINGQVNVAFDPSGSQFRVNGGSWLSSPSVNIENGNTLQLRLTSSGSYATARSIGVYAGTGAPVTWTVTTLAEPSDTTPDAFTFDGVTSADLGTVYTSDAITPTGYNAATAVTVTGGQYSIDGGTFTALAGTISPGQTIALRGTSPSEPEQTTSVAVTIGGVQGVFAITTGDADTTPDAFSFDAVTDADPVTYYTASDTITGLTAAAQVVPQADLSYSIDGGAFTFADGTISNGQTITVRLLSGGSGATVSRSISIGGVSAAFSITTAVVEVGAEQAIIADVYLAPGRQDGHTRRMYIGNTNYITAADIIDPATGYYADLDGGEYTLSATDGTVILSSVPVTGDARRMVGIIPAELTIPAGDYVVTLTILTDGGGGATWTVPIEAVVR